MDKIVADLYNSGKRLVADTKVPSNKPQKTQAVKGKPSEPAPSGDPHQAFIKRCIADKPKKKEVVEMIKQFIERAEAAL